MKEMVTFLKKKWLLLLVLMVILESLPKFYDWLFSTHITDFFVMNHIKASDMLSYAATVLSVLSTFVIGSLTLKLSRQIKKSEDERYELKIKPFLMLREIIMSKENCENNPNFHFYEPNCEITKEDAVCFFKIKLINTSENFCRVKFKQFNMLNNGEIIKYNGSSSGSKAMPLFLKSQDDGDFLFKIKEIDLKKGTDCRLEVYMHNNFGKAYIQKMKFYIFGLSENEVLYGIQEMSEPEEVNVKDAKIN